MAPAPLPPPQEAEQDEGAEGSGPGTEKLPEHLCPITLALLRDPVLLVNDTHTYERSYLDAWFVFLRERGEPLRSPKTGAVFEGRPEWVANAMARACVAEWEARKGGGGGR